MSGKVQSGGGSGSGGFDLKKFIAEAVGTSMLTYIACGGADAGSAPIAFGFTYIAVAYTIGSISDCHINPAVSLCMLIKKKMSVCEFFVYIGAQFLGGFVGSFFLGLCKRGQWGSLYSNYIQYPLINHNNGKKDGWSYVDALLIEIILTFIFVFVVQGATDKKCYEGKHAGIIIGLALALVYNFGDAYTRTSVNPARSLGPALLELIDKHDGTNNEAIKEIWIFIIAPLAGGALSGLAYDALLG